MKQKTQIISAAFAAALAIGSTMQIAHAKATDNMVVTLTLPASCTIKADPLNFNATSVIPAAGIPAQTNLKVLCSRDTAYSLALGPGNIIGSRVGDRKLVGTATGNTTTLVDYGLYSDATHTTVWGNTAGAEVARTGTGSEESVPVYGLVKSQVTPKPDTYRATVIATVTF